MSGKGFARRVTIDNLGLFLPLLGQGRSSADGPEGQQNGPADAGIRRDPALAAAEQLFDGTPFRTGARFEYQPQSRGARSGRHVRETKAVVADEMGGAEVLLMRVRPRRDGTQLQISLLVHRSSFMREAPEVRAASDGALRQIGFDYVRARGVKKVNLARFEAPELRGMSQPVARFKWIQDDGAAAGEMLQYEIFDAANSSEGEAILSLLEAGIGEMPNTAMKDLSQVETVLSKRERQSAQWYRLQLML